jgi:hypothetical protein
MNINNLFLVLLVFLFPVSKAFAQIEGASESRSGSFYSLFGVGYPTDNNNARELGLGIIGVSLDNMQSNSLQNPALWGRNTLSTASTGLNLSKYQASSQNASNVNALLEVGYFQVTLPIMREKFGVSASMYSVTRSNYRFVTIDSAIASANNVVNYASDIRGAGGINKLEVGFGWSINKNISIGYAPSLTFVTQNNSQDVFFNKSGFGTSNLDAKVTGTAMGQRFGALLTFRNLIRSRDRISIGAEATLPITIDAKKTKTVKKIVENQEEEVTLGTSQKGDIKLPLGLKGGITYYPSQLLNISAEGLYQGWGSYESAFDPNTQLSMMSDRYKLGFGVGYHPYRTNSAKFLSNFRYSGGISYDSGHLTISSQDINTLWFSAGLGIISPRSSSTVDLSIRYGLRGTTNHNLIREKIWAFNLSVNLSELMFFRKKLQ